MIFKERPADFSPRFEIASCYLEHEGKFVMLHRHENKSQGGKWGVVAGKLDAGESPKQAMVRELREETGVEVAEEKLEYFTSLFVRHGGYDLVYHMFRTMLDTLPEIKIEPYEHQAFTWVTPEESLKINLVDDLDECIKMYYGV